VLKNGESDHGRAVTVVGPDLTNVSCFNNFNNCKIVIGCSLKLVTRNGLLFLRGEGWGVEQLPKNSCIEKKIAENKLCKESQGEKIKQVLSTIQVPFFDVKKIHAQTITHQKDHAQSKGETNFMPQKITRHFPQKNNGPSLNFMLL